MRKKVMSIFISAMMVVSISVSMAKNVGEPSSSGTLGLPLSNNFRGNLNHTGLSPYDTSGNDGELKWSFKTGHHVISSPRTYNLKVTGGMTNGTEFEGYSDEIRVIDPPKEDLQIEPLQNDQQMKPIQKELQEVQFQGVPQRECFQEGKQNKLSHEVLQNNLLCEGCEVKLLQEPIQSEISQVSHQKESSQEKPKSGQSIEEPLSEPLQELITPYLTVEKSVSPTQIYKQGDPGTPNNATVTMTVTGVGDPIPKEVLGPADIVFVVDNTGSMRHEIEDVKKNIGYIVDSIEAEILDVQFGLASYRDHVGNFSGCGYSDIYGHPGDWVFKIEQDITTNTNDFKGALYNLYANGGADRYEAVADAIYHTTHNFTWRGEDVAKIALLLGDGPGHDCDNFYFKWGDYDSTGPCPDGHTILDVIADSKANDVIWATIGWDDTGPNYPVGWAQWNYLAEFTGGEYRDLGSEDIADVIVELIISVVPDFINIAGKNAIVTEVLPPYIFLVNNTYPHWIIKPPLVYILWSAFDPLPTSFDGINTYTWDLGTIRIGETRTIKFNIQSIEDGYGKLVDEYPDTRLEYLAWNGIDFLYSIMVPFPETLIDVLISSQWPNADAGPDQTVKEGDIVELNGSSSSTPNGTIKIFDWDFDATDGLWWETGAMPDATGPIPTYIYGDDGIFKATLRVTNNQNLTDIDTCNITVLNVDPKVTIESAIMDVEIGLRVAGRKYNNVSMTLSENEKIVGYVSIERMPGSPDEQMAWIPVSINFSRSYSAIVTYIPEDPPNIGGNPVWIYIKSKNGSMNKIHHTFNVQQSKKRDSDHWNHVEPWEVDLNPYFIGLPFEITSHITDPGSDDETLTFTYGSQVKTVTYLNNPPNPDPYPSPEVKSMDIMVTTTLVYEGSGTVTLVVKDDDNIRLGVGEGSDTIDLV